MLKGELVAGGISYRIIKGFNTSIMKYLSGHDEKSSFEILQKNKLYFIASANKIIARFELAKIRIENIEIEEKDSRVLNIKLNNGVEWLKNLIQNIKGESDVHKFPKEVPYKEWHAIKLIPSAAEGYAITASIKKKLNQINKNDVNKLKTVNSHNNKAKEIFFELLNLEENSDFKLAEKQLIKGYEEIKLNQKILRGIILKLILKKNKSF
ncbi:MAG: hypothetical protein ACLPWD_06490 [Methanobacterium sp.]